MASIVVVSDPDAVAALAAERLTPEIEAAVQARGSAFLVLSGGHSPARLFQLLADPAAPYRARIPWAQLHVTWSDERHVPPDHPDSNFGLAQRTLLERVPINPEHVYRMRGELADATRAAALCEEEMRAGLRRAWGNTFSPDVLLLGIGEDAHIASIFPDSPLLLAGPGPGGAARKSAVPPEQPLVAAVWAPHLDSWRLTLTPAAILAARRLLIIATGATKAGAVHAAVEGPPDVRRCPAQMLREAGDRATWVLDAAAAAQLRDAPHA